MEWLWIILLIGNFIFAMAYAIVMRVQGKGAGAAVFFLFLPILGIVIYFLPFFLSHFFEKEKYDRDSLVHRKSIARMAEHPNIEEELDLVPMEDAMAINENREKRELLLRQLKKDTGGSYKALLAAEKDEDSETVHYVAAAKMEIYRRLHQEWQDNLKQYDDDRKNAEKFRNVSMALKRLIESRVLSGKEKKMYQKRYCSLMEQQVNIYENALLEEDYETWLIYLIELGRFLEAQKLWDEKRDRVKSEDSYMKMAEMFYQEKEKRKFHECIGELKKDRQISLTAQGLEQLRYWMQKE